jgi:superfamily I DNA/RNA helicase
MALIVFAGKEEGTRRVTLSTLHSAKGREFDVAIMFGVNQCDFPGKRDLVSDNALREARRLFYVGVTRPAKSCTWCIKKVNIPPGLLNSIIAASRHSIRSDALFSRLRHSLRIIVSTVQWIVCVQLFIAMKLQRD